MNKGLSIKYKFEPRRHEAGWAASHMDVMACLPPSRKGRQEIEEK
jgi:hypothetical protein